MKLGGWEVKVAVGAMPQKVATAFSEYFGTLVGAEYTPIAYLGSQVVNGINHAILAEQVLITGRDEKNVVLIVMNERGEDFTVVRIENLVAQGAPLGGIKIDVETKIPEEAQRAWNTAFEGFVGSTVVPFAYLGSQVTNGTDYIFAATTKMIVRPMNNGVGMKFGADNVVIVVVHTGTNHADFINVLEHTEGEKNLGYAFTW